jgi:hypothetical protein
MSNTTDDSPTLIAHKRWLRLELSKAGLDHSYLIALTILLERVVNQEQSRFLKRTVRPPFYRLTNGNGKAGRAWLYAAEAALWLNYKGYDPAGWFEAICNWPPVKRRLLVQRQVPMHIIAPATRLGVKQLKAMERFYLEWARTHARY